MKGRRDAFRNRVQEASLKDLGALVFGDRLGLIVFLAAIAVYLSYWRIGMLINDTYTVANTLVAVADGQFHVERAVYGPHLETPGMGTRDGRYYGRNYGQVFLALPFLWAIQGIAAVADLRVALAASWAFSLLGLAHLVGAELDRPTVGTYVGCGGALVVFVAVLASTTTIDATQHYIIALQLQTMVAAALVGVVCYRLLHRCYARRVGFAGGLAASLVTPVGFWAQFPKRHVLVTLCVVSTVYLLYRSREGDGVDVRFRATAYVPVGIAAWISAAEGLILLFALLAVDVPTAGRDVRSLMTAGVTCVLAVVPMFITNLFVTGNPAEPPRVLTAGGSGSLASRGDGGDSGGGGSGGSTAADGGAGSETGNEILDTFLGGFDVFFDLIGRGAGSSLMDLDRLYSTFIRGGYIPSIAYHDAGEAIRLSFLEAMPLAAALIAVPIIAARSDVGGRFKGMVERPRFSAVRTVDAFTMVYAFILTLVFLPRLPLHATITVRYLLPLFPLSIYGLFRLPAVRRVIEDRLLACGFTYLGGVLIGGQFLVVYFWTTDAARGEAVQTHALLSLAMAALVAGWAVADAGGYRNDRLGAVALGLAAASGTTFLVLAALWHFAFVGGQTLPLL